MSLFFIGIGRWFLSKLTFKTVGILILLCLLAYGGWTLYNVIYQRGVTSQTTTIKSLQDQLAKSNHEIAAVKLDLKNYQNKYVQWQKASAQEVADTKVKQQAIVDDLTAQLSGYTHTLAQLKKVKNDLSQYISKANDASCVIPSGVVFLYNSSLQTNRQTYGFTLSPGSTGNAYTASGISLSQFTGILIDNNAEAVHNRQLVLSWQKWYQQNKTIFNHLSSGSAPPPTQLEFPSVH